MVRRKILSEDARTMLLKVHLFFSIEAMKFKTSDGYFQRVQKRVAEATGISKNIVNRTLKEMDSASWQEVSLKKLAEAISRIEHSADISLEEEPEILSDDSKPSTISEPLKSIQLSSGESPVTVEKRELTSLRYRDLMRVARITGSAKKPELEQATFTTVPNIISVQVRSQEPTTSNTANPVPSLVPIQPNTRKTIQYVPSGSNLIKIQTVPSLTPIQPNNKMQNARKLQLGSKVVTLIPVQQIPASLQINQNRSKDTVATSTGKLFSQVPTTSKSNIQNSKTTTLVTNPPQQKKIVKKKLRNIKPKVVNKPNVTREQKYIRIETKTVPVEFDTLYYDNMNAKAPIKTESIEILD